MFLPIGDSPNFKSTPWVTYALIAINVMVFVSLLPLRYREADPGDEAALAYQLVVEAERGVRLPAVTAYDAVVFEHGFKPRVPEASDVLTAMFMHGGSLHLLGNMLFLWIYGDNVEHRLGRWGFTAAYLGTGLAAAAGDALLRSGSAIPSIGASGAISGVLGFYFVWFPRNRVRVWVFLFPFFADVVELPARLVLGIYLVVDNILPALLAGGEGGVAHGAHLGGFVAAAGLAWGIDRLRLWRPEPELRSRPEPRPARPQRPGSQLRQSLDRGDPGGALTGVMDLSGEAFAALSVDDLLELGGTLGKAGHPRAALAVYHRMLAEHARGPATAAASLGMAEELVRMRMPAEAYQHAVRAVEDDPSGPIGRTAASLLRTLGQRGVVPRRWR